ncbi:MAG: arylamine N-acetyltransferase [Chloroflexi bacterium AL-W]|nr:arylamine N-acetyltransferase [Chloroflexi bacterium AL-N1]NOK71021.1 arylamine N-acetyltransferase [Chloroflexi bacterium AL-N10]NOK72756.1 arylamine N-acetyltransferase [Chloroflexi bacterium AL-N5]NOK79157.1 arylamine N-acetyltransferase [Chloroflexi bacterium AL-W]NOK87071.1 arylamine N-acetyltransferase [Chloroflexi bacterium AL-N15]
MDINAYLKRINYHGSRLPNAQTLSELQLAHLLAVPFENLSIHAGEPIVLTDKALFDKVIRRGRGGFCYELNGLFAALLRALGFEVTMLSCRVVTAEGDFSPDFDHMALMVSLDQRWLVDVGFGDTFRQPLAIDDADVQTQFGKAYRIVAEDAHYIMMEHKDDGTWKAEYCFSLQPYQYIDYIDMCHYHQTSPESHFTQRRICSRATPAGRVTLSEMRFITTTLSGERQEREVTSEEECTAILFKHFGITMER